MSALSTTLTRGALAATASTACLTTAITSSQSPSTVVNIASVWFGRPLSRTTRTASATYSPTASPTPSGVTENATSMAFLLGCRGPGRERGVRPGPRHRSGNREIEVVEAHVRRVTRGARRELQVHGMGSGDLRDVRRDGAPRGPLAGQMADVSAVKWRDWRGGPAAPRENSD